MKKALLFCLLCSAAVYGGFQTGRTTGVVLESFNTGQVSPGLEARQNFPKYESALRTCENFLIDPLGPVQRRPGTRYVATAKSGTPRLLKFEYSTDDNYAIEAGDEYMRFYRNGGQILDGSNDPYDINTPFQPSELWDIRYAQNDNEMVLVDGNDAPQLLTRTDHADWDLLPVDLSNGPFLDENTDTTATITPSGDGDVVGYDYYTTNPDQAYALTYGVNWKGQTFRASAGYDAGGVRIMAWRIGSPGTVTVALYATSAGLPTGAALASGTTDGDTLPSSATYSWREVTFGAAYTLVSGTTYAIVVSAGSGDADNRVNWRADETAPSYNNGSYVYSLNGGSSWTANTTVDMMFDVLEDGASETGLNITLTATADIFDSDHVGSLWKLRHLLAASETSGTWSQTLAADQNSTSITVYEGQKFTIFTSGTWYGVLYIQRSGDEGTTWENVDDPFHSNYSANLQFQGDETEDEALYRLHWELGEQYDGRADKYTLEYHLIANSYWKPGIVQITAVSDGNDATATVLSQLGGTGATYKWSEGAWSDYRGWPKTITFHQQRAVYGGTTSYPTQVWFSATGDSTDFAYGTDATNAFTVVFQGQNPIRWLLSEEYLLVGTSGSVGRFGAQGDAISPDDFYIEQSTHGSAAVQALVTGDSLIYVERNLRKIREFAYALQYDRYVTPDLTILSPEITDPCVVEIAFQARPQPMLWCVLGDGNIATLTYYRDQAVAGWSKQTTDGDFESFIAMPGSSTRPDGDTWREDSLWAVATRDVNGTDYVFIENFTPFDYGDDPNYAWYVDCGLSTAYSGLTASASTFTGMSHLAYEDVAVLADANNIGTYTINGSGVLDPSGSYTIVTAGLPFTSKLETLPMKLRDQSVLTRTSDMQCTALNFDFRDTNYLKYGMGSNSTLEICDFEDDFVTDTINFRRLAFPFGSEQKNTIYVETAEPMPLGIRAVVAEITYYINR